jgi:predicted ester cyclase
MTTAEKGIDTVKSKAAILAEKIWQGEVTPGAGNGTPGHALSVNEMKSAMVRLYDESNKQNFAVFDEMFAKNFVSYGGAGFQDLNGAEAFRQLYIQFISSMPDLNFHVEQVVAEGNYCGVRGTLSGTHKGNFMGFAPPTGKLISWTGTAIFRFDQNGLMDARWQEWDGLSVMQQMGVIPATPLNSASPAVQPPPYVPGATYTSPDQNKKMVGWLIDQVWNRGNLAAADEIYHPQATYPSNPTLAQGSQGIKNSIGQYRQAMTDFHADIKNILTDGDMVLVWLSQTGTHNASLMGVPPTGKKATWGQIIIARFAGGHIVESWSNEDILGLMQQLGVGGSASSGA